MGYGPLGHAENRKIMRGLLGSSFQDVPVYLPGADLEDGDVERIIGTFSRDGLGHGAGAEMVYDVYVLVVNPAVAEDRAAEIVSLLLGHLHKKCFAAPDSEGRMVRVYARAMGVPPQDFEGWLRRQVVVTVKTDEEVFGLT